MGCMSLNKFYFLKHSKKLFFKATSFIKGKFKTIYIEINIKKELFSINENLLTTFIRTWAALKCSTKFRSTVLFRKFA